MRPRTWWWWPYQLWKYLVVIPVGCAATLVGSVIVLALVPFVDPSTLSRQIAEAHGGRVRLANRKDGPGCVAEVRLPERAPGAPPRGGPALSRPASAGRIAR